jgi:hypothetical protein
MFFRTSLTRGAAVIVTGMAGVIDRQLRGLTGAGPSQVGVCGAMRARDVSRPAAADLAAAEAAFDPTRPDVARRTRRPQPAPPGGEGSGGSTPEVS